MRTAEEWAIEYADTYGRDDFDGVLVDIFKDAMAEARAEGLMRGQIAMKRAALDAMPCTSENPNESAHRRGHFDGVTEYAVNLAALPIEPEPASESAERE